MAKFFTFADRTVTIPFFDENPVVLTLVIGDETDQKIAASGAACIAADKGDVKERSAQYRKALTDLIGEEKTQAILSACDGENDGFAVGQVLRHIWREYGEAKAKKLNGSVR